MNIDTQKSAIIKKLTDNHCQTSPDRPAGFRYPPILRRLVGDALRLRLSVQEIQVASGIEEKTLYRWAALEKKARSRGGRRFRRLKIVGRVAKPAVRPSSPRSPGCFIFPSGVRLEVSLDELSSVFLSRLGVHLL